MSDQKLSDKLLLPTPTSSDGGSSRPLPLPHIGDVDKDPLPTSHEHDLEQGSSYLSMHDPYFLDRPDTNCIHYCGPCPCTLCNECPQTKAGNPPEGARYDPITGGPVGNGEPCDKA